MWVIEKTCSAYGMPGSALHTLTCYPRDSQGYSKTAKLTRKTRLAYNTPSPAYDTLSLFPYANKSLFTLKNGAYHTSLGVWYASCSYFNPQTRISHPLFHLLHFFLSNPKTLILIYFIKPSIFNQIEWFLGLTWVTFRDKQSHQTVLLDLTSLVSYQ